MAFVITCHEGAGCISIQIVDWIKTYDSGRKRLTLWHASRRLLEMPQTDLLKLADEMLYQAK